MNSLLKTAALGFALLWSGAASAQQVNLYCWVSNGPPLQWAPCSGTNPLPISGGGGGAVTIANGADTAEGSTTDAPATAPTSATAATAIALQKAIVNGVTSPIPAGTNIIGGVFTSPTSSSSAGITPIVSAALESNHVIKAGPGNLYSAYITTGAVGGYFLVSNTTTAPSASGAAIAPIACVQAPPMQTVSIGGVGGPPIVASTGITLVFSTSGCLTNTASSTAFFSGQAQ